MNEAQPLSEMTVQASRNGLGTYASKDYSKGDVVLTVQGIEHEEPNRYSIQVGVHKHLYPRDEVWKYLNHSCSPNLQFRAEPPRFEATRSIAAGEELSFNYLTTEWEIAEPFDCGCGASNCFGRVEGFRNLSKSNQSKLLDVVAPHIRKLLERAAAGGDGAQAG